MVLFFVSPVAIASLGPGRHVASLGSINGDGSSRERVFVVCRRISVVEPKVLSVRPVHTILMIGTGVMVVFTIAWSVIWLRRIRTRVSLVALLHVVLGVVRINCERRFDQLFLLPGDVAGGQGGIVEWSHVVWS